MNLIELDRALRQLRLGGMAAVLETRLRQAQAEAMALIDLDAMASSCRCFGWPGQRPCQMASVRRSDGGGVRRESRDISQ